MSIMDKVSGFLGGGSSSDPSSVYGAQDPYLQDLYSRGQMASYGGRGTQYAQNVANQAQGGLGQMLGGGFQNQGLQQGLQGFGQQQNQALGGAIQSGLGQINRNFQRNIMPGINMGAAMTGTSGGSRQGIAQGLAASDANQQASDFVNQMQSQNWGQQMQNQLGAYGQQAGLQGQQNQMLGAGMGMAPQMQNLGFGAQYGNLQNLQGLIGSPTVLGGGGQSTGGVGSSLSGGADIAALSLFSDRRVKENIKKVGKLDNGLNVYSYNYIGQKPTQIGVMAQEVEIDNPQAVSEINGIKLVNYNLAVA